MNDARDIFARHGLRCTRQRAALYDALRRSPSHPTADELYRMVRPRVGHLSLATVYNTLDAFCEAGLCRRLPTVSGCSRYDADTSEHIHVRDRESGAIADVPPALSERLIQNLPVDVLREIEDTLGVRIEGLNLQLIARRRRPSRSGRD